MIHFSKPLRIYLPFNIDKHIGNAEFGVLLVQLMNFNKILDMYYLKILIIM
jgi:hypothetical protein